MADDQEETETVIHIMIVDEAPTCNNPNCENDAIGVIEHPVIGVVAVCGDCLGLISKVDRIILDRLDQIAGDAVTVQEMESQFN
jgi:hypothetical protein